MHPLLATSATLGLVLPLLGACHGAKPTAGEPAAETGAARTVQLPLVRYYMIADT